MQIESRRYIKSCFLVFILTPFAGICNSQHLVTLYGGKVNFDGKVVNSACSISADSQEQTVQMGQVRSNQFPSLGSWANDSTPFEIHLEDCDIDISLNAAVSFSGVSDSRDPQVFKAGYGAGSARGIGIGIFDERSVLLIPNTQPLWYAPLQNGENVLHYSARYRSTENMVQSGNANSQVWFSVVYQ